jgi:large subunit ribosomal protein L19
MSTKLETFNKSQLKTDLADIRSGDTVRIYQKIPAPTKARGGKKEEERVQIFEGLVIAKKHGQGVTSTITVRRVISGIGVERIFPIHLPTIEKIEILKRSKVRRAKLYYLRRAKGRKARLKKKEFAEAVADEIGEKREETSPGAGTRKTG